MKLKGFAACVILAALFGCQMRTVKTVPEELRGQWETSAPLYVDCTFELRDKLIIFRKGTTYIDINHVKEIEISPEKGRVLFIITYENKEGGEYKLSLFYFETEKGDVIRFKNQQQLNWTRKKISAWT